MSSIPYISLEGPPVIDAEWTRTNAQEGSWILIDAAGTTRNIAIAVGSAVELIQGASTAASTGLGAIAPFSQLLTGPLCLGSAVIHTIPAALKELNGVAPNDQEGKFVARLGLINQIFFAKMGAATTACGVASMLSPTMASLMHYQPVLQTAAATQVGMATGGVLGGVYAIRGVFILTRALYNLNYLNEFERQFAANTALLNQLPDTVNPENREWTSRALKDAVNEAVEYVKGEEKEEGAFKRRVGEKYPEITSESTLEKKIEYLEAVEKGIFTKKLQQKLSIAIGIAMVIGGLLSIAALCLSGPALPIILLISGIFFAIMESVYLHYDSSALFNKLRDRLYIASPAIQQARETYHAIAKEQPIEVKEAYTPRGQKVEIWAAPKPRGSMIVNGSILNNIDPFTIVEPRELSR